MFSSLSLYIKKNHELKIRNKKLVHFENNSVGMNQTKMKKWDGGVEIRSE